MTYILGLTGSIGMGKSTTAQMFRDLGHPVWDADAAVHHLYAPGGAAVERVAAAFPTALRDGGIDRQALKSALSADPDALDRLERIVHPLVAADRSEFVRNHEHHAIVVLDIPLLFEQGGTAGLDGVAVVSTDAKIQRDRVLARRDMDEATFRMILARQLPDKDKRARADWVIPTDTLENTRKSVAAICKEIMHA